MTERTTKIGIILPKIKNLDTRALKYLILYQNTLQDSFLFQFLPTQQVSQFLNYIESDKPINRQTVETKADKFIAEYY